MYEFVTVLDQYVVKAFEGLAFLASMLFYNKYKRTALKLLPWLLGMILLVELCGIWVYEELEYNAFLFNITNILFFMFFFHVFYHFLRYRPNKKWAIVCAVVFGIIAFIDIFKFDFIKESQLYSYFAGACLLISCIILYFIEMLRSSRVLSIRQDLMFWISTGLLLFYVGYLPIKLTRKVFSTAIDNYLILALVHLLLIIFMNIFFIIGLIWKRKN